jgi:hypothetical protein
MIILQLGALLVSLPTVEQAVEFVELVGLAGQFPMPEIPEEAPSPPRPTFPPPMKVTNGILHVDREQIRRPPTSVPSVPTARPSMPKPPRPPSPPVERPARAETPPEERMLANDVDDRIVAAFRANPRALLPELASEIFPDRPNGLRLIRMRLVALEGCGRLHRVSAGQYGIGPAHGHVVPTTTRKRRQTNAFNPRHEFDDETESDEDLDEREGIESEAGIDPDD